MIKRIQKGDYVIYTSEKGAEQFKQALKEAGEYYNVKIEEEIKRRDREKQGGNRDSK